MKSISRPIRYHSGFILDARGNVLMKRVPPIIGFVLVMNENQRRKQ